MLALLQLLLPEVHPTCGGLKLCLLDEQPEATANQMSERLDVGGDLWKQENTLEPIESDAPLCISLKTIGSSRSMPLMI